MQKDFFTAKEVLEYASISKSKLYKATMNKEMPFYKPGKGKLYFKLQICKFL